MEITKYIETFCNNIHRLRERAGMSLDELAERSGITLNMLEQLEQSILPEEMMVDDACALARVLQCELYELLK